MNSSVINEKGNFFPNSKVWIVYDLYPYLKSNCLIPAIKDILGTKWKNDSNKPLYSDETIKVCVPKKTAFPEYIDVDKDGKLKGGFSMAIFCLVLQELPFKIQHGFMPFTNQSYTEVVQKLESQVRQSL